MRPAFLVLALPLAGCIASDDGDGFLVQNGCGYPIDVDVVRYEFDLQESDLLVRVEAGATEFVGVTTADPESVFVEAFDPENGARVEFEVPAAEFVEGPSGDFTIAMDSARCP